MANAHAAAVRSALKMNDEMGLLTDRLRSSSKPSQGINVAYRNALRALGDVLPSTGSGNGTASVPPAKRAAQVAEVMQSLRVEVALATQSVLEDAMTLGAQQAGVQLNAYGVKSRPKPPVIDAAAEGLQAVLAILDAQIAGAMALTVTGADPELIVGSSSQMGVVQPAPVLSSAWFWIGTAALAAWAFTVAANRPPRTEYLKQAVAAIDERTTDCCLRVHGQAQPLNDKFHLTGRPRFAEYKKDPPFHWNCRTATALVLPEDVDDELTAEMTDAARAELAAREDGSRVEIHPASARSRR